MAKDKTTKNQNARLAVVKARFAMENLVGLVEAGEISRGTLGEAFAYVSGAYLNALDAVRADGTFAYGKWTEDAVTDYDAILRRWFATR